MPFTETKIKYEVLNNSIGAVPVIIVAAGSSTRMNGVNKQLIPILNVPVLARTLMAFENSPFISNIILVVKTESLFEIQMMCEKYSFSKLSDIVCGGNTRQESVLKGFSRLKSDTEKVLIHDGARPLVDNQTIKNVVLGLEKYSAVTCGVSVKDTIKEIDADRKVVKTLKRDSLVAVQTPQGVRFADYLSAVEKITDKEAITDDMMIMENAGFTVLTVEGNYKNIKITTMEDINLAESYITGEEE